MTSWLTRAAFSFFYLLPRDGSILYSFSPPLASRFSAWCPAPPHPQSFAILLTVAAPVAVCIGCYSAMGDGPAIHTHLAG